MRAAIVTIVYAGAVSDMAKKNAFLLVLPAVENLDSQRHRDLLRQDGHEMTLTAVITSNRRYEVNVNSTERTRAISVRGVIFLEVRVQHHKFESVDKVLRTSPGIPRRARNISIQFALSTFFGTSSHYSTTHLCQPPNRGTDLIGPEKLQSR